MEKKKKVVIIGSNGQLGHELMEALAGWHVSPLGGPPETDIDITDRENVKRALFGLDADFVINTAAFTNVPLCEEKKTLAFDVNAKGAMNVACVCRERGVSLVHISTDYVFDGKKGAPYLEDDEPHPLNYYGVTKFEAERMVAEEMDDYYILRTSGLYGKFGCLVKGENFVDKMLRFAREKDVLKIVDDEVLTPTSARDLSFQIKKLLEERPAAGIYHATNAGECSWYEFTKEIFRVMEKDISIEPVHQDKLVSNVKRPRYSVLENAAFQKEGIDIMGDWKSALKAYLEEKKQKQT